jgi:hypothetical protein
MERMGMLIGSLLFKYLNPVSGFGLAAGIVAIDYTQIFAIDCIEIKGFA